MRRARLVLQRLTSLYHYTIEASPKKDAQVAYLPTPDAAVHSV